MNNDAAKAYLTKEITEKIQTWEDFYAHVDKMAAAIHETRNLTLYPSAYYTLYAFVVALRDNPEEGDIKKLMEIMVNNMTVDCETKLHTKLVHMAQEEMAVASLRALTEVLQVASGLQEAAEAVEEAKASTSESLAPQGIGPKKTLH